MDEYVFDLGDDLRPAPRPARRAEMREQVLREARSRAERYAIELVVEEPRRSSDVALLWFQGERTAVLRTVGGWEPSSGLELQIAHAGPQGAKYELALYVVSRSTLVGASDGSRDRS